MDREFAHYKPPAANKAKTKAAASTPSPEIEEERKTSSKKSNRTVTFKDGQFPAASSRDMLERQQMLNNDPYSMSGVSH